MPSIDHSRDFGPSTMPTMSELDRDLLHPGAQVGGCVIVEPIGQDDTGILYLADDPLLQRHVLIREHFPRGLAARAPGGDVLLAQGSDAGGRATALSAFLRGARWLTRFDHPSIGRALRVWEERGTAYMLMPAYEGESLAVSLQRVGVTDESWLRKLLVALCDALGVLHAAGVYHLGLSPESIWLMPDGRPMLLDLSAVAPASQRLVNDSVDRQYAPIELFAHGSHLPVGPWTDIYSLGAIAHLALVGRPPVSAAVLGPDDVHAPLSEGLSRRPPGRLHGALPSAAFLAAVDRALAVRPENRPQDLGALRALLDLTGAAPVPQASAPARAPVVRQDAPPVRPEPPVLTREAKADPAPVPPPAPAARQPEPAFRVPDEPAAADSPDAQADAAAAAAIAMAMSSLPWAKDDAAPARAEPSGFGTSTFGPLPGRPVPREPGLGPQSWTMPGPSGRRRPPARKRREPTRAVAAVFGLLVCLGMAGWYVAENPAQIAGWLDPSRGSNTASAQSPEEERAAAVLAPRAAAEPIERVLIEQPPAAGPAPSPSPSPAAPPPPAPAPAPVAAAPAPEPSPPPAREPTKVAKATPARKAAAADPDPDAPPANNPRAACGSRTNFALFRCMETQCGTGRFSRHPQCVEFRQQQD